MRISVLILSLAILAIAAMTKPAQCSSRQERSIRDWFSGMMKRFQRRGSRSPYYLQRQTYQPYYPPAPSYGTQSSSSYGEQYAPQAPSYLQSSGYGAGIDVGVSGGIEHSAQGGAYSGGLQSGTFNGGLQGGAYSGGLQGGAHSGGLQGGAYSGGLQGGGGGGNAVHGFGPLKSHDVINYGVGVGGSGESYLPSSDGYEGGNDINLHSRVIPSVPVLDSGYEAPAIAQQDTYVPPPPPPPPIEEDYSAPVQILHGSDELSTGFGNGQSYVSPSNSIHPVVPTNPQYIPPSQSQLPLESEITVDFSVDSDYASSSPPTQHSSGSNPQPARVIQPGHFFPQRGSSRDLVSSGKSGDSLFAPNLGPDDPIIEIVFQDGEPAPPHPPPVIDESYFAPASDDVEVYFIEYSPEDNLDDLKSLDLSNAQPAILQNLPNELPYELRNHLVNSGVLENAQIEIIDLDKALNDQSLDINTRNQLRQAYSRTHREAPSNTIGLVPKENKQSVDIRVKRLNHNSKSPEGIVEFLSGLKTFRKGTFAGTVDVNDKNTDKYLPVTVDGRKFPLPDNLPLENKKVDGVLVLAPERNKITREPKSSFTGVIKRIQASPTVQKASIVSTKQRRILDIDWADMDTNGWIPIVDVKT